jgi:hypothetical protein
MTQGETELAQAETIYNGGGTYMGMTGEGLRDYIYKLRAKVRGFETQEGRMEIPGGANESRPSKAKVGKITLSDNGRK